jgi:hypothetical protein
MPSLDALLRAVPREQDAQLLEGQLVKRSGGAYARIGDSGALLGPLRAADDLADGEDVLLAVSQLGNYWVVASGG